MTYRTKSLIEEAHRTRIFQEYKYEGQIYRDHEERVDSEGFIYEGYTHVDFVTNTELSHEDWRHPDGRRKHIRLDGDDLVTLYRIGEHRCDGCLELDEYRKPCWSIHPPEIIILNNEKVLIWQKGKCRNCTEEETKCTNTIDVFTKIKDQDQDQDHNGEWVCNESYRKKYEEIQREKKLSNRQREALLRRLEDDRDPHAAQRKKQQEWKDSWSTTIHQSSRSKSFKHPLPSPSTDIDCQSQEDPTSETKSLKPETTTGSTLTTPILDSTNALSTVNYGQATSTTRRTNNCKRKARPNSSLSIGSQRGKDISGKFIGTKPAHISTELAPTQSDQDTSTKHRTVVSQPRQKRHFVVENHDNHTKNGSRDGPKKRKKMDKTENDNIDKKPQEQSRSESGPRTLAEALQLAHFSQSDALFYDKESCGSYVDGE